MAPRWGTQPVDGHHKNPTAETPTPPRLTNLNRGLDTTNRVTFGESQLPNRHPPGSVMSKLTWRSIDPTAALKSNWNNSSQVYPQEAYKPGLIIRGFFYEQAYSKGSVAAGQTTVIDIGPDKEPLCAKIRFFIVVASQRGNYTAIPLYTHGGNGLAKKEFKEECASVRDHRNRNPDFAAQSWRDPLLTAELNDKVKIDEKTTAWLTYPISRSYLLPVTIEGYLDEKSTKRLIRLYSGFAPREDTLQSPGHKVIRQT